MSSCLLRLSRPISQATWQVFIVLLKCTYVFHEFFSTYDTSNANVPTYGLEYFVHKGTRSGVSNASERCLCPQVPNTSPHDFPGGCGRSFPGLGGGAPSGLPVPKASVLRASLHRETRDTLAQDTVWICRGVG